MKNVCLRVRRDLKRWCSPQCEKLFSHFTEICVVLILSACLYLFRRVCKKKEEPLYQCHATMMAARKRGIRHPLLCTDAGFRLGLLATFVNDWLLIVKWPSRSQKVIDNGAVRQAKFRVCVTNSCNVEEDLADSTVPKYSQAVSLLPKQGVYYLLASRNHLYDVNTTRHISRTTFWLVCSHPPADRHVENPRPYIAAGKSH